MKMTSLTANFQEILDDPSRKLSADYRVSDQEERASAKGYCQPECHAEHLRPVRQTIIMLRCGQISSPEATSCAAARCRPAFEKRRMEWKLSSPGEKPMTVVSTVKNAVVTALAYCTNSHHQATKDVVVIVGLNTRRIIDEKQVDDEEAILAREFCRLRRFDEAVGIPSHGTREEPPGDAPSRARALGRHKVEGDRPRSFRRAMSLRLEIEDSRTETDMTSDDERRESCTDGEARAWVRWDGMSIVRRRSCSSREPATAEKTEEVVLALRHHNLMNGDARPESDKQGIRVRAFIDL